MLPGILSGIEELARISAHGLETADPRELAGRISTLFAQFEVLVSSTRQFYSYLTQVLTRFDLGREEFEMFKSALLDYLQRFIDEISRHMPQVADRLRELEPSVPSLCERANAGERLVGLDGASARRATGLEPGDWESLHLWFVGAPGRRSDADNVRRLATDAMRSLLMNLRRIAAGADRQQSRYGDLVRLAGWFDAADDAHAHDLWAAAFGLYSARHLSFAADPDGDPVAATQTWWGASVAEVPIGLRVHGERKAGGRTGARADYSAAKKARLAAREREQQRRAEALRELAGHVGEFRDVRLSDDARTAFLDLHAQAMSGHGRALTADSPATATTRVDGDLLTISLHAAPSVSTTVTSPAGRLMLCGLFVEITVAADVKRVGRRAEG
jgi:uncharacterized protein (TIGR02677 family)